eukprot:CAMPEP_0117444436 /NCGR_PEP_ID=MMETSP0759-20121206/5240_1 /TAXON_ID=63605 /ORGANISM="Percolomonas cosmopolitus, Strain WS" /LENGTH=623 /DNA_ID=CAMNT_0005236503 /DNA_START=201 /DNA_END=2072 /DNA_ORIENTATION=+
MQHVKCAAQGRLMWQSIRNSVPASSSFAMAKKPQNLSQLSPSFFTTTSLRSYSHKTEPQSAVETPDEQAHPGMQHQDEAIERESMDFDVVIVGAGPSGLSTAIRLKQLDPDLEVCVVEKGSYVGAHILSGACIEPRTLNELIPDWKEKGAPLKVEAKYDEMRYFTANRSFPLPVIPQMSNHGNYLISLGELCAWMAEQAEELGVQIFPGFPANEIIFEQDEASGDQRVAGIVTRDMGIGKDGKPKSTFEPGMELRAKHTVFSEGCRGSLSKQLFSKLKLREGCDPQTYALGVKEVWEVDNALHKAGTVIHTLGHPLDSKTYGGSFMYHLDDGKINLGFVVALDYENPTLSPYEELQRYKSHPDVKKYLENGKCISYGARTLSEGGLFSLPKFSFPGGIIVGDSAGFLNVPKIKGIHTSMKSGMLGAEAIVDALKSEKVEADTYREKFEKSWLHEELHKERNIRHYFKWGLWPGLMLSGLDALIFRGKAPWDVRGDGREDHEHYKPISEVTPIQYPKKDNKITFDLLANLSRSNTNHEEDQPCHLKVRDPSAPIEVNLKNYGERSMTFCPAGVYEFVDDETTETGKRFQINAQNCLHCKACDIKDSNIDWTTPEGNGGPSYASM